MFFKNRIYNWIVIVLTMSFILVLSAIGTIDREPLTDQPFYSKMMEGLDTLTVSVSESTGIQTSWAKVNITPSQNMPMAGYKRRDHFDSVHDSLFARILLLKVGTQTIAFIDVDLLLFPPVLKLRLEEKLSELNNTIFLYVSATHTHNGIGGWDNSLAGNLALGSYHEEWVEQTAENIKISLMSQSLLASSIKYWESEADDLVVNRIAYAKGEKDGKLRGLIIKRSDSTQACLFSFSAHATSIRMRNLSLSADYPGWFIQHLEKQYDFGMYMAGMVGSHSFAYVEGENYDLIEKEGALLAKKFSLRKEFDLQDTISVSAAHIPIVFGSSQLRIAKNWKARDWVLHSLFGKLQGELTYLRLGDVVMIGTPCDFSGEIAVRNRFDSLAVAQGKHLIINSFNGNYVGYITDDAHYDSVVNDEVRVMNWVGPYYGAYFSSMIKKLLQNEAGK